MRQVPSRCCLIKNRYILFLIIVVDVIAINIVTPLFAAMLNQPDSAFFHQLTHQQRYWVYGLIQALSPLCYIFGAPLIGFLSDKFGRKSILRICLIGSLLAVVGYSLSFHLNSWWLLGVARIIAGLTSGSLAVAQSAIADSYSGINKTKEIAFIAVAMSTGLVLGPIIGGVLSDSQLVSWFSPQLPFMTAIVLVIVNVVLLQLLFEETPKTSLTKYSQPSFKNALIEVCSIQQVRTILLVFCFFELGWSQYYQGLSLLLSSNYHFTTSSLGTFLTITGIVLSIFLLLGVRVALRYISTSRMLRLGLSVMTAGLLLPLFLSALYLQWIVMVVICGGVALAYSSLISLGSDKIQVHLQGTYMGVTDSLLSVAFTITALSSSWIALANIRLLQPIAAVFILIALVLVSNIGEKNG